jgi:hypothetical protein
MKLDWTDAEIDAGWSPIYRTARKLMLTERGEFERFRMVVEQVAVQGLVPEGTDQRSRWRAGVLRELVAQSQFGISMEEVRARLSDAKRHLVESRDRKGARRKAAKKAMAMVKGEQRKRLLDRHRRGEVVIVDPDLAAAEAELLAQGDVPLSQAEMDALESLRQETKAREEDPLGMRTTGEESAGRGNAEAQRERTAAERRRKEAGTGLAGSGMPAEWEAIRWVASALAGRDDIQVIDAPSPMAYAMWEWARSDDTAKSNFWTRIYAPTVLPAKKELDEALKAKAEGVTRLETAILQCESAFKDASGVNPMDGDVTDRAVKAILEGL